MSKEIWKTIPNFIKYEVSNKGHVRNKKTEHILCTTDRNGYPSVSLRENSKSHTKNVHRLVASAFIEINDELFVNHKNGNKYDNSVENLEYVTAKENSQHAILTGLTKPGNPRKVRAFKYGTNEFVGEYNSCKEAASALSISDKKIGCVCRGNKEQTCGYVFEYADKPFVPIELSEIDGVEIEGYENYLVTRDAKIYSKKRQDYLVIKVLDNGYQSVKLCDGTSSRDFYVHVLFEKYFGKA